MSTCRKCGKDLVPAFWGGRRHRKYCSNLCYRTRKGPGRHRLHLRRHLADFPAHCVTCGKQFARERLDQVNCSASCAKKRNREYTTILCRAQAEAERGKVRKCEWCREPFAPSRRSQVFCTVKCQAADARGRRRLRKACIRPAPDLS